jgi:hypothetical protein
MGSKKQSVDVNLPGLDRGYVDELIASAKEAQQGAIDYFGGQQEDWLQRGLGEQERLKTLTGIDPNRAMENYRKEFAATTEGITSKYEPRLAEPRTLLFKGGVATAPYGDLSRALDIQQGNFANRLSDQAALGFSRLGQGFNYPMEPLKQAATQGAFNPLRDAFTMGVATNPQISRGDYSSPEFRELSDISGDRRRITNLNV